MKISHLINSSEKTTGGPFTRYDPGKPYDLDAKSCLDLVIVSKNLEKFVKTLKIDDKLAFTPFRVVNKELKFTDHYSLLLEMEIPRTPKRFTKNKDKQIIWNTNKPD